LLKEEEKESKALHGSLCYIQTTLISISSFVIASLHKQSTGKRTSA